MFHRLLALAITAALLFSPLSLRAEMTVFSAQEGVAIGGYDVVAYFDDGQAEPGIADHSIMWKGVIWRFSTAENQASFEANPRAFAPRFGGYCAYAMSQGYLAAGNPQLFVMSEGRLFLLNNASVHEIWRDQSEQLLSEALENWPALLKN